MDQDLLKKVITGDESWVYVWLWHWTKSQSYHFATIEAIKEKSKQELEKRIGKNAGIYVLCLRGVTLKGQDSYWEINKSFFKNLKITVILWWYLACTYKGFSNRGHIVEARTVILAVILFIFLVKSPWTNDHRQ